MNTLRSLFPNLRKPKVILVTLLVISGSISSVYFSSKVGATSAGVCSNPAYTNQADCILDRSYCSNSSFSNQSACEGSGSCSDTFYTTASSCTGAMCGGSAASCSNPSYSDQNSCESATCGGSSAYCSDANYTDQSSCQNAMCGTDAHCSGGSYSDQASCEGATCGYTGGTCSGGGYTDQFSCEGATCQLTSPSCSNPSYTDQSSCEGAMCSIISGYCSSSSYTDQSSCQNATCGNGTYYCTGGGYSDSSSCTGALCGGTSAYCSNGSFMDQSSCENDGYTWYPEVFGSSCGYSWIENTSSCGYYWTDTSSTSNCGYSWNSGTMGNCGYTWTPVTPVSCGYSWIASTYANCNNTWYPEVPPSSCGYIWTGATEPYSCGNIWTPNVWTTVSPSNWSKLTIVGPIQSQDVHQGSWSQAVNIDWGAYDSGTCQYSYDNATWLDANCSLNGSDIPAYSTNGNTTLYVRNSIFSTTQYDSMNFNLLSDVSWSQSSNDTGNWTSIAMSRTGEKIVAAKPDSYLVYSNNSGSNWSDMTSSGISSWTSVAMSANGKIIAAGAKDLANPIIRISKDGGSTWIDSNLGGGPKDTRSLAMSSDGSRIVVATSDGLLYITSNAGSTWSEVNPEESTPHDWTSVAMSAEGKYLYVSGNASSLYMSDDFGTTWYSRSVNANWLSVGTSARGDITYAVDSSGNLYRSNDYGVNWSSVGTISSSSNFQIALSADASLIYISSAGSPGVFSSVNSGNTWFSTSNISSNVGAIAVSREGNLLAAGPAGSYLYIGTAAYTSTLTPQVTVSSPNEGDSVFAINPVVDWGTSDSCFYSIDGNKNFVSTSCTAGSVTVSEQLGAGSHRISFYGNDGSVLSGDSVGFTILPSPSDTPPRPSLLSSDTGRYNNDRIINYRTGIAFSGIATSNASIILYDDSTQIGASTTDAGGNWSITGLTLNEGTHSLTITAQASGHAVSSSSSPTEVTVDLTGPIFTNIDSLVATTSAVISWDTDKVASSRVTYTTGSASSTVSGAVYGLNHSITLNNLTPETDYSFEVGSTDIAGNATTSGTYTFKTDKVIVNQDNNLSIGSTGGPTGGGSVGGGPSFGSSGVSAPVFPATTASVLKNNNSTIIPVYGTNTKSDISASISKLAFFILPAMQGTRSAEVEKLQRFLNTHGFQISKYGPGSPGKETSYFGPATKNALARFQKSVGIKPASGIFGPATKAYINKHYTNADFEEGSN